MTDVGHTPQRSPFVPTVPYDLPILPPDVGPYPPLPTQELLKRAHRALGLLTGMLGSSLNPQLLLSPALMREAVASSDIEGVHTTVARLLQAELFPDQQQRETDKEVLRYRDAITVGTQSMREYGITTRTILTVHQTLMGKTGGRYRQQQNRIENRATGSVVYTPPPAPELDRLMANWENYVNTPYLEHDPLIRLAVAHFQLEAMHPFEDGNGRTGRIIMILQLMQDELIPQPYLFLSGYINQHRPKYYELLRAVTEKNEWYHLIDFILSALIEQSDKTCQLLNKLTEYKRTQLEPVIASVLGAAKSGNISDLLITHPILTPSFYSQQLGTHLNTAHNHLEKMMSANLLYTRKWGRYQLYIHRKLLEELGEDLQFLDAIPTH